MNMILVGCVVLFLHDPCDTLLIFARSYTDYKNRNSILNAYFGNILEIMINLFSIQVLRRLLDGFTLEI